MTYDYREPALDLGNEVAGSNVIDLADQLRDAHGKFTRSAASITAHNTASAHARATMSVEDRQRATQRALLAASQKRIMAALNTPPDSMSDEQIAVASRIISNLTPHDYSQIRDAATKVVPAHVAEHVNNRIASLSGALRDENNTSVRKKLITHLAVLLGALGLSFLTAGLGAPVGISALVAITPSLAQEFADWRNEHLKAPVLPVDLQVPQHGG